MATKRKIYKFRQGDILDVEEHHDGNYGGPGKRRIKREKPTREQMRRVNAMNKARKCRQKLLQYFDSGDCFVTWTYEEQNRPLDMKGALKDFQKAIRTVRKEYRKKYWELFWIRNIERGTRGAWHIHLVVNETGSTLSILEKAWPHGGTWGTKIRKSKIYDEDFTKLSNYMTKDEHTPYRKKDGTEGKSRIKESNYGTSRNMPLPEPKKVRLHRWPKEPKPKKGYYIVNNYEGINPVTGYKYRRYTMIRLDRKESKKPPSQGKYLVRMRI